MCLQHFVAGLYGFQLCRGVRFILILVGVMLAGTRVGPVVKLEYLIAEILLGVGSSDEYPGGKESDHQDGAEEFWKTGSGGIYGRHAENACPLSSEMQEMPVKVVSSSASLVSTSL